MIQVYVCVCVCRHEAQGIAGTVDCDGVETDGTSVIFKSIDESLLSISGSMKVSVKT